MLAILAVAVLAVSTVYGQQQQYASPNDVSRCDSCSGISVFDPAWLCGKKLYSIYMTGNADHANCGVAEVTCLVNGTIVTNSKLFINEALKRTSQSTLEYLGNGLLKRTFATENGEMVTKEIILFYSEYQTGEVKLIYELCSDDSNTSDNVKLIFLSSMKNADFSQEIDELKVFYPTVAITAIPNNCDVDRIFP